MPGQPNIAAEVELRWADGTYLFALKLKQIEELQRLCSAGLGEIAQRLLVQRRWYVADIVETIRLGLVGGGLPAVRARELIDTYVEGHPLADPRDPSNPLATAQAIIMAAYFGVAEAAEEPEGKAEAAADDGTDGSTSRPSPGRRSRSASRRSTSAA
ncbi:gene transfer agent family protein [Inquilinus sp. NPDC058860]|uniref:gene transfer agent family protein n=1 Tax=Inquilinus sp. NPDC058860 TaxID=3346652 RepID=UPI0036949B69